MRKVHLGKTATSRTRRKKVTEDARNQLVLQGQDDFMLYLIGKGYGNTSIQSFYQEVKKFMVWLDAEGLDILEVGYNDITAYLHSLGSIQQNTKGCYLRSVRHYFDYLVQQGSMTDNPATFIALKGIKRKTLYDILSRQELDSLYDRYGLTEDSKDKHQNWFRAKVLAHQRNKVILGMMVYQALDTTDLSLLSVQDVKLREGRLYIPGRRRSNERELRLESMQIMDLMDYLRTTRKGLLGLSGKKTEQLFVSTGDGDHMRSIMAYLIKHIHKISPKVTSVQQLRTSVIVHWLKRYNLREVQYMAGHRYVSSTEQFLVNDMAAMIEGIEKYHPIG